jgi:DNA-binding transcriptional regulator PaaX
MNKLSPDTTSAIVDGILKFVAAGGLITTALIAPNTMQIFDKPIAKALNKLDERSRERELRRVTHYMKARGLIKYNAYDYEHGIEITKEGRERLKTGAYSKLAIPSPKKWDQKWRLVFFDIPVGENRKRRILTAKLRQLGFQQLQMSIWIHPFPCRSEIETITEVLKVRKFLTYIEISKIDAEKQLRIRFKKLLSKTTV